MRPTPEERQQWRRDAGWLSRRQPETARRILTLLDALDAEEAERQRCHRQEMRLLVRLEAAAAELADVRADLDRVRALADEWRLNAAELDQEGLHDDADRLRRRWTDLRDALDGGEDR